MDYTTFHLPTGADKVLETEVVTSLYETLQHLADARRGQGKRYELALILCLLVLAKLAGETSLSGAIEWIRHRAAVLAEQFGLRRTSMPCQMTYCNVLARVDAKHLGELFAAFLCAGKRSLVVERNQAACTHQQDGRITLIWPSMAKPLEGRLHSHIRCIN